MIVFSRSLSEVRFTIDLDRQLQFRAIEIYDVLIDAVFAGGICIRAFGGEKDVSREQPRLWGDGLGGNDAAFSERSC